MDSIVGSWRAIVGSVAVAALALVDPGEIGGIIILLWSIGCTIAITRAARGQDDETRRTVLLLAWTAGLTAAGFLVRGIHGEMVGLEAPIPSPADFLHIPAYSLFFYMVLRVHRARANGRNLDAWLDALTIVAALFVVLWVTFLGDFVLNESLSFWMRFVNSIYTTIILATFTLILRITATPGVRPNAYYLLGFAGFAYVVVDLAATFSLVRGTGLSLTIALSPFVYGLAVAATAHPSKTELMRRHETGEFQVGLLRLTIIGFAIVAPSAITILEPNPGSVSRAVLAVVSLCLSGTVVARVLRLLRERESTARMERRLAEEIGMLAPLESASQVRAALPAALYSIVGDAARVLDLHDPSHRATRANIPLPESLLEESPAAVVSNEDGFTPRQRRIITSLVRDAGLVALSAEGVIASARRESEIALNKRVAQNERRFRALVQNASDIFIVLDAEGRTTYASDAITRVLGYELDDLIGKQLNTIVHENDQEPAARQFMAVRDGQKSQEKHEFRAYTADGDVRLFEAIMTDMTDVPEVNGVVINGTDVTAERSLERDLKDAETIDALTLQLNRKAFIDEIDTALRRASISGAAVSIAIIDLDDFKTINDALGPVLADQALVETANRIRRAVRIGDVVARLSGDEFGILMPDGYSALESVAAVERVLADLQLPFTLDRHPLSLKATAGISINVGGTDTASILLKEADTALGTGKREAPGKAIMFEEEMSSAVAERLDLRSGFERALQNDEMRLVYQPIIDMKTGRIVSLEALARWRHPDRGEISPSIFIPIAEDSNTITPLGEWALRTACRQVNEWSRRGLFDFTVSVNMSGQTLIEDDVISRVRSILEETDVDPSRIIIEITETVLIDDTEFIADRISALRSLGVALAIDDFGTGYSSLSYLQRYEFDYLKIDRAFVRPLESPENVKEREIVAAIISLARGLGATTIAEGIEGDSEHRVLETLNCDRAQGFLFHRPKEVAEIFDILCEDLQLDVAA